MSCIRVSRALHACVVVFLACNVFPTSPVRATPAPSPTQFAFILPAHTTITFKLAAQISVTFMPVGAHNSGKITCRRIALSDQATSRSVELWFDQGSPPSTIVVWKGVTLRSLSCEVGGATADEATLYITGTTL